MTKNGCDIDRRAMLQFDLSNCLVTWLFSATVSSVFKITRNYNLKEFFWKFLFRAASYSSYSTSTGMVDTDFHRVTFNDSLGNSGVKIYAEVNQTSVADGQDSSTGGSLGVTIPYWKTKNAFKDFEKLSWLNFPLK